MKSLVNTILTDLRSVLAEGGTIPYAFLGYSVGALVAIETCEHASLLGLPAPILIVPVGAASPSTWNLGVSPTLPNDQFVTALHAIGEISKDAIEGKLK